MHRPPRLRRDGPRQPRPDRLRQRAFGNAREAAAQTLSKGWLVSVTGRLQHDTWEQDDAKRESYGVIGHVEFLTAPKRGGDSGNEPAPAAEPDTETAPAF